MTSPRARQAPRNPAQAWAEATALLEDAVRRLATVREDEVLLPDTPVEMLVAMDFATEAIGAALERLRAIPPVTTPAVTVPGGRTAQQGQFLAFIREYMARNYGGVAPCFADFERFFNLTPPSVNSMLKRLEQRGFIRRLRGQARAIEIICSPELIPPLARPFKF